MSDGVGSVSLMMTPPKPLFDVKEFLPEGITPENNGMIPVNLLKKVHCGGQLYLDAARAWMAMVRAAAKDNIFLNLNHPLNVYKNMINQRNLFLTRFAKLESPADAKPGLLCVEFDNQLWQLREDKEFVECPGTNTHGYALAVFIVNEINENVRGWLDRNAESFGFVREYDFIPGRFVYIRGRQSIPERVLEIENLPPEPLFSAEQVARYSGCKWYKAPPDDWHCNGIFYEEPYRVGAMAVVKQGSDVGIHEKMLDAVSRQCTGIICTEPTKFLINLKRPILISTNIRDTIDKLNDMFQTVPPDNSSDKVEVNELLHSQLELYKRVNPETAIFQRKKRISRHLLKISVEELKSAPEQSWYKEYHALLAIRLENPALRNLARKYCDELMQWYDEHSKSDDRELAIAGLIQFIEPTELRVPFNEHLWHKEMITDVRGVFLHQFTRISYTDEDIITYYLARQQTWTHGKRKMRVVFIVHSVNKADKMMPVFDALKARDDVELTLVLHPSADYKHGETVWKYFHEKYHDSVIYDTTGLLDLRKLKPDYVFYRTPYEWRRHFSSFTTNDIVRFAKVCNISYGATLSHTFIDRLLDEFPRFYRNLYFMFCSAPTVKKKFEERYQSNIDMGYQHIEFLGYPLLEQKPLPMNEHSKKTILWTPRWSYETRIGGSHFLEYKDNFVALRQRYGDKVNLSIRPHENTFRDLQEKKLITAEEVDAYKKSLKDNNINLYYTTFSLDEQFRLTDILLGDYSSILIVYFLTGRPIVYCKFANAVPFDEYKEMFDCMYIAHTWDEAEHYLDELVAGNDPLYERRQAAIENIRAMHAGAAQKIVERLIEDFKRCEDDSIDEGTVEYDRWK